MNEQATLGLEGHRALVTGGASGIGRATARRLAAQGVRVAVADLDAEGAHAVAEEIGGLGYALDVTDSDAVEATVASASEELGGLSIVFNNAGVGTLSRLADHDVAEWRRVLSVNLDGAFYVLKATLPRLKSGGDGRVVNSASISATRTALGNGAYAASKAALVAITANAAREYAPEVRVNAVSPGTVRSPLTNPAMEMIPGWEGVVAGRTPLGRIGEPDDVADVVVFLCSDLSRYVTGQNLVVDGGMTLQGAGTEGMLEYLEAKGAGASDEDALAAAEGRWTRS